MACSRPAWANSEFKASLGNLVTKTLSRFFKNELGLMLTGKALA